VKNDRHYSLGDAVPRHPITGIGRRCARSKGHSAAAAPPSSAMTSRRFMSMAALKILLVILTAFAGLSFKIGKPQADNMQGLSAGGFY
jgi:hypothetical protein